jgi:hypothetical protein
MRCPKCGHTFEYDILQIDENDPKMIAIEKYHEECEKKFQDENPCPKCGSHNVDCDWGTPTWCNDCGYEWG